MPELRWILIVFGVALLVGIYVWGRRGDKQSGDSPGDSPRDSEGAPARARSEPHLASRDAQSPSFERSFDAQDEADVEPEDAGELVDLPTTHAAAGFAASASLKAADYPRQSTREASPVRRGRVEPTFHEDDAPLTEELPVHEPPAASPGTGGDAPTLAMSDTPPPRRIERRKIIALRLAAPSDRYAGQQLRDTLQAEALQHGKYEVFHRLHDDGTSVFSVASMVEPGTFDLGQMGVSRYPGVTLFAQLPGPAAGVQVLQELVACGKRLQSMLGGTLQDERGVPLTAHRIERLRQEIQDFERAHQRDSGRDSSRDPQRHSVPPAS